MAFFRLSRFRLAGILPVAIDRIPRIRRPLGSAPSHLAAVSLGLLAAVVTTQTVTAAPFISEIFLPGSADYPGSGVEISGIGDSGASLLVIDAKPDGRLVIRRRFEITLTGTALLADLGTLEAVVPPHLRGATAELPAFSLPLSDPVALAVFDGTTGLQTGVALNQSVGVGAELTANPIVDWVVLSPGDTASAAEAGVFTLSDELAAALGIDDLPRPIAPTFGVTTLARPALTDQPELGLLLPGSIADGISGASANLHDFAVSPGVPNPLTAALSPVTPEPGSAVLWAGAGLVLAGRKRRSRCLWPGRGL